MNTPAWTQPIRLKPIYQQRVWGGRRLSELYGRKLPDEENPYGESWEVSDREEAMSTVEGHSEKADGMTLHQLWEKHREEVFGQAGLASKSARFPLLVKILDCQDDLSLQVHPPAEQAASFGGEPKTEIWHIARTSPGAKLYAGLKKGVTKPQFEAAIQDGTTAELVHTLQPQAGDFLFLPGGRLHGIGGGTLIFEIQQNSDTTYRVFDWNRPGLDGKPRQLHIDESMASIDFDDYEPGIGPAEGETLVDCEHFKVERWDLPPGSGRACLQPGEFCVLAVVEGGIYFGGERLKAGDFRLVPAAAGLQTRPIVAGAEGATLLISTLPTR